LSASNNQKKRRKRIIDCHGNESASGKGWRSGEDEGKFLKRGKTNHEKKKKEETGRPRAPPKGTNREKKQVLIRRAVHDWK